MKNQQEQYPAGDRLWSVEDACDRLGGIGSSTLYRWKKEGRIQFVKIGGVSKVPQSEIDRLIAEGKVQPEPEK